MKKIKISLLFLVIINIFTLNVDSGENERFVILSGKVAKIECEIKEDENSNYVSTKGTGTITFFEPITKQFAAVGHSINKDVNEIDGNLYYSEVSEIKKSEIGEVGNLKSKITSEAIGCVRKNNDFGVFGDCDIDKIEKSNKKIAVLKETEVEKGSATLVVDFGDNSKTEYEIEILNIFNDATGTMDYEIQIKDKELIEKTGGIVKGMSGSPIIQNGKLVGALARTTNTDPTKGYGIFAERMLKECELAK